MHTILEIQQKNVDAKGRAFRVHLVAYILADDILARPNGGTLRPILLSYAGTASAVRAFTANLRCGETAVEGDSRHGRKFELLRSLGYRYEFSSSPAGVLCTAYLPAPFHLRAGSEEQGRIEFVSAPPTWWLDRQVRELEPEHGLRARSVARARAYAAYLDQRTPLPIANDPHFHAALFDAAAAAPWTSVAGDTGFTCVGLDALGLEAPLLTSVHPDIFGAFLADLTATHLPKELAHGSHRFARSGRVLSNAAASPAADRVDGRAA